MMMDSTTLPRGHGAPLGHAVLKSRPEDFEVTERLGFPLDGTGEHVCLLVEKRGQNTAWVAEQLATFAGVRHFDVSYAGRKDRHAVTRQWFSVWLPGGDAPDWDQLSLDGVAVLEVTRHGKKLRRGCHAGNRFRVVLRDMIDSPDVADRLGRIARDGFPNYFGEQRFGRGGGNLERASALLSGDARPDRKKDLYLSAARSYLFNAELAQRVSDGTWLEPDAYGWLPGAHRKPPACLFVVPERADWYEGLERLGVKAQRRPLRVIPEDLGWEQDVDTLTLTFTLPAGAFATTLLRELADTRADEPIETDADG